MATRIWQSTDNTINKTTIDIPAGILSANTPYEFRARHKGAVTGYSNWASKIVRTLASFGYNQLSKLVASDGAANDNFGYSVAVSYDGTTVIVGAYLDDAKGSNSGSAYIYRYNGTDWNETQLVASDGAANDNFGCSVAVSGDGNTVVVGAKYDDTIAGTDSGSAYIYRYDGTDWNETKLVASDGAASDNFSISVAVSGDGNTVVVGAYLDDAKGSNSGSAYVYKYNGTSWDETKLLASDGAANDYFGYSVDVSSDGNTVVVGAYLDDAKGSNSGSAYIYKYNGTNWNETKLVASDGVTDDVFGISVAVSGDGNTVVAGAYGDDDKGSLSGSAYVYKYNGTGWDKTKLLASDGAAGDYFGSNVAVSYDGSIVVVGALIDDTIAGTDSGSVYVFNYNGTGWYETKLVASDGAANDYFSTSVAVSGDGNTIVVGVMNDDDKGTDSGSVYIFKG